MPHESEPHAALPPEHVSMHAPVVHVMLPHALLPVHVRVQSPVVQPTLPHDALPVHVTLQFFVLQVIALQASVAVQSMSQPRAPALMQLTIPHAPAVGQLISQFHPSGHVMLPLPVPVIVHVAVARSQPPLQIVDGHTSSRASAGSVPTMQ